MTTTPFALALALALGWSGAALAQDRVVDPVGSATRGAAFITGNCDACHATGKLDVSPNLDAPPFREVARRYEGQHLDWELEAITQVGHYRMPPRVMTSLQVADVVAYIRGLAPVRENRKGRTQR